MAGWVAAAALVLVAGCAPPSIRARGVVPLNVNTVNESTTVDVRFYQLTEDGTFLTAPFESLWTDAPAALGGTLIGKPVTRTVFPGALGDPPVTLELAPFADSAKYLGVLALFRGGDGSPRQLAIRSAAIGDGVLELTGYSLRFNTGAKDEKPREEPKPDAQKPVETTEEREAREQQERTDQRNRNRSRGR